MINFLDLYGNVVGITSTFGILLSAVTSDHHKEKIRRAMFSDDDLESASYDATEAFLHDVTQGPGGRFSFIRLFALYATINAAVFFVLRFLQPNYTFQLEDANHWTLIALASFLGLIWFVVSFFASQIILRFIKTIPDALQLGLTVVDFIVTHIIIVACVFLFVFLNLGVGLLFETTGGNIASIAYGYTIQIFMLDNGIDQVLLAQYISAFAVTAILWIQILVASLTRFLRVRETETVVEPKKKHSWNLRFLRLSLGRWIKPNAEPFMVGTLIFIFLETIIIFAFWLYQTFAVG